MSSEDRQQGAMLTREVTAVLESLVDIHRRYASAGIDLKRLEVIMTLLLALQEHLEIEFIDEEEDLSRNQML